MVFHPLEGRDVASLSNQGDALEVSEVVMADISAFGIFLTDGPDGCGGGIEVLNWIGGGLLLFLSIIYQKTSGLGVPTGFP